MKNLKCPICSAFSNNQLICSDCSKELSKITNSISAKTAFCDELTAPFFYDGIVRNAIHDFKFNLNLKLIPFFCYFMLQCDLNAATIVLNVPNFNNSIKNCSFYLAKKIANELGAKFKPNGIKKIINF